MADWTFYPFPLSTGELAWLNLPQPSLTQDDADRLTAILNALAIEAEGRPARPPSKPESPAPTAHEGRGPSDKPET